VTEKRLGLLYVHPGLDDEGRGRRSLERRLQQAKIARFKPLASSTSQAAGYSQETIMIEDRLCTPPQSPT
jgi:hypothetical protein